MLILVRHGRDPLPDHPGEVGADLSGGGAEGNLSLGDRYTAEFEADRYKPSTVRHLLTFDPSKVSNGPVALDPKALGEQPLDQPANDPGAPPDAPRRPYRLSYGDAKVSGAYIFSLTRLKGEKDPPGTPAEQPDYAAVAFNVDAAREGDLRRANTDDLATQTNKAPLHNIEDLSWIDDLKQRFSAHGYQLPALMREIGLLARTRIYQRTIRGLDQADSPFQPYSPAYATSRAQAGLSSRVTLQVSGDMLNAMTLTEVTEDSVTIGFAR